MKTTIKFSAILFIATLLFSCQEEEILPTDIQIKNQTTQPIENTPNRGKTKAEIEHGLVQV